MRMLIATVLFLAACRHGGGDGKGSSKSGDATSSGLYHSLAVADSTKLPQCTAEAEGWLVYLRAEAEFQACSGGQWSKVDVKGEKGEKGDKGDKGEVTEIAAKTETTTDEINFKRVIDGGGVEIGTSGTLGPDITIRLKNNPSIYIGTNLTTGLPEPSEDVTYCYYLSNDCSGNCLFTDETKILRLSASSFMMPGNDKRTISGSDHPFGSRKSFADGGTCHGGSFAMPSGSNGTITYGIPQTFALPLHLE